LLHLHLLLLLVVLLLLLLLSVSILHRHWVIVSPPAPGIPCCTACCRATASTWTTSIIAGELLRHLLLLVVLLLVLLVLLLHMRLRLLLVLLLCADAATQICYRLQPQTTEELQPGESTLHSSWQHTNQDRKYPKLSPKITPSFSACPASAASAHCLLAFALHSICWPFHAPTLPAALRSGAPAPPLPQGLYPAISASFRASSAATADFSAALRAALSRICASSSARYASLRAFMSCAF
jgi:hypothetical protein